VGLTSIAKKILSGMGLTCARNHRATDIDLFELAVRVEMQRPRAHPFFFVQIGANDGELHDPIHRFVDEFQWHGLLIEPIPSLFQQLLANYAKHPQMKFENCAIAPQAGSMTLYTVPEAQAKGYARGLASFDKNVVLKHKDLKLKAADLHQVVVPSAPVTTILEKHQVNELDLLQIDTEGFDYEVLKMFDFKKYRPRIVQFEFVHLKLQVQLNAFDLLRSHGYKVSTAYTDAVGLLTD
jgi:FkbM family methyltransferase